MWTCSKVSVRSRSNWNLEVLVFEERGKREYPEKNLSEQGREPTTNSTHIWRRRQDLNPGHIGGRRVLSPLRHPCSPMTVMSAVFKIMFLPLVLCIRVCWLHREAGEALVLRKVPNLIKFRFSLYFSCVFVRLSLQMPSILELHPNGNSESCHWLLRRTSLITTSRKPLH